MLALTYAIFNAAASFPGPNSIAQTTRNADHPAADLTHNVQRSTPTWYVYQVGFAAVSGLVQDAVYPAAIVCLFAPLEHDSSSWSTSHSIAKVRYTWSVPERCLCCEEAAMSTPKVDVSRYFDVPSDDLSRQSLSSTARGMVGSQILRIAGNVRTLKAQGVAVSNFTVGDFAASEFSIPDELRDAAIEAYGSGRTNYPPPEGDPELRQAVVRHYAAQLGLEYPAETVQITSGARPGLYAAYAALIDPQETVIYPVPSWNNNHYAHLVGAQSVALPTRAENGFMPTAALLEPHLKTARLLALNSPLNPTGTMMTPDEMKRISALVLRENERRKAIGERLLYVLYDQIYWELRFGDIPHVTPVEVAPEMAAYTIFVDGISKSWAATGLRVGWVVGPPHIISRAKALLTHLGAWAPHPEQAATANVLAAPDVIAQFSQNMHHEVKQRLDTLYNGVQQLHAQGLPINAIAPQGAIYLSVQFNMINKTLDDGTRISTNDQIVDLLLNQAGVAVVPFQAFGLQEETGWMRFSVGAVSVADIERGLEKMAALLKRVK